MFNPQCGDAPPTFTMSTIGGVKRFVVTGGIFFLLLRVCRATSPTVWNAIISQARHLQSLWPSNLTMSA